MLSRIAKKSISAVAGVCDGAKRGMHGLLRNRTVRATLLKSGNSARCNHCCPETKSFQITNVQYSPPGVLAVNRVEAYCDNVTKLSCDARSRIAVGHCAPKAEGPWRRKCFSLSLIH